jgi:hypothetical protein
MAVPWLRRLVTGLFPQRFDFMPGSVHEGFVVNKVALRQVSLLLPRFYVSISFHCGYPYSYVVRGMNNRPVGGHKTSINKYKNKTTLL